VAVSAEDVKKLREQTGAGIMDAKAALEESGGDLDKATEILHKQGHAKAAKRAGRATGAGLIEAYVHMGRVGVLVEVGCETDFVAKTDEFKEFVKEIAMQVAATSPESVSDGENALLGQPFIKDESKTVGDLLKELIAKLGENIVIKRFSRYELGGGDE
jgi:elongation factor Ts